MLIVGLISTKAEQKEIYLIAHVWMVGQRSQHLAKQVEKTSCSKHSSVQQQL